MVIFGACFFLPSCPNTFDGKCPDSLLFPPGLLVVPKRSFDYGLHKLVFRFQVESPDTDLPLFKEAHTYFIVQPTPLEPALMEGFVTKVSRGWTQSLLLDAAELSKDPDFPTEKVS